MILDFVLVPNLQGSKGMREARVVTRADVDRKGQTGAVPLPCALSAAPRLPAEPTHFPSSVL